MLKIEQAIFTSAETGHAAGYQVVAKSPGICKADACELAVWGPSHDSMLDLDPDAVSINFHPLPSGRYCISRTTPAGWEYSGRGGRRVYTQCLIVPPEVLERFSNNPFAIITAALAGGMLKVYRCVPSHLDPMRLSGSAAPVDQALLSRLAINPGPGQMASLVQSAYDSACLAIADDSSPTEIIAGLLQCLPPECRCEFSFSTGLKFSSRRPFRIIALSNDPASQRWLARKPNVTVLEISGDEGSAAPQLDGWAQLVGRVFSSNRYSFLAQQLSQRRPNLSIDDLPALGLQILEDLESSEFHLEHDEEDRSQLLPEQVKDTDSSIVGMQKSYAMTELGEQSDGNISNEETNRLQHAHSAHQTFSNNSTLASTSQTPAPSTLLDTSSPKTIQRLERLDDLVYESIAGKAAAWEELKMEWPQAVSELGEELLGDSRERYLRYALSIWEGYVTPEDIRNPSQVIRALDVLCLLFDAYKP